MLCNKHAHLSSLEDSTTSEDVPRGIMDSSASSRDPRPQDELSRLHMRRPKLQAT